MTRTRPGILIVLGLIGVAVGFMTELILTSTGRPLLVPPVTLAITLGAIAVVLLVFAIPIRRAVKGTAKTRINPFQAFRVAILAKASSLCGGLLTGALAGLMVYMLTRTVLPALTSIWMAVASLVGAAVLLAAGLVAEHLCTLPPGEDPDEAIGNHAPHRT